MRVVPAADDPEIVRGRKTDSHAAEIRRRERRAVEHDAPAESQRRLHDELQTSPVGPEDIHDTARPEN